jgi:hypothetical protein
MNTNKINCMKFLKIIKPLTLGLIGLSFQTLAIDPAKVMGPEECTECHDVENSLWENTHHFSTFEEMPEQDEALEIAEKLEIDDVIESPMCQSCHLTMQGEDEAEAIAGVSCESCHGAASDWMDIHSEEDKPADQTQAIWAKAESHGMIRPSNLTSLAGNCLDCHLVKDETLVNKGGHKAGSEFNLVTWSQGEVRHNTFHSEDGSNRPAEPSKLRKMYVIGSSLELQRSLLAYTEASDKSSVYAQEMKKRIDKTKKEIEQFSATKASPLFQSIHDISKQLPADSSEVNKDLAKQLLNLAKKVESESSEEWSSLDSLISELGPSKGTPQE